MNYIVKNDMGFEMDNGIVMKSSVGSINYNLEVANSDRDFKLFVHPTFKDLYKGERVSICKEYDGTDLNIIDIRNFSMLMVKSNINFLEVLFARELEVFEGEMKALLSLKEDIARVNVPYLYKACIGTAYNKHKLSFHPTEKTRSTFEKYGYDIKSAYHSVRILDFLVRYAKSGLDDFGSAIRYRGGEPMRALIMKIREGKMPLAEFEELYRQMGESAKEFEDTYLSKTKNEKLINHIDMTIMSMVEKEIFKNN